MVSHDEFLELCAVSVSGQLREEDRLRLNEHLAVCPSCREALRDYEAVVNEGIPAIGAERSLLVDPGPGWCQSKAEKAFFERLAKEEGRAQCPDDEKDSIRSAVRRAIPIAPASTWRHIWMLYLAGTALFVTLFLTAFWVGVRRGTNLATSSRLSSASQFAVEKKSGPSLEEQISDVAHERELARAQIDERDKVLADLRRRLQRLSAENVRMQEAQDRLEENLQSDEANNQELVQQRTDLIQRLGAAQAESQALQNRIDLLARQATNNTARAEALSKEVDDLSRLLEDRDARLNRQDELLAHDRDIRELIGARNLYIAEVYDTDEKGGTLKPYGRVFYTKEKSLIFYAYDLDQQDAKPGRTFQAWGRRGPDWKQAVNLGIFYQDNASKKRWVLKSDDPQTLAHIDAVFVTIEPRGGSDKPSGKPLLFAYLNNAPNHP